MPADLAPHLEALRHSANVASLNYDIWWVYKSKEYRPIYVDTMNRYLGFFDTSLHAHFVALLVALYPMYETRRDTFNLPRLLKVLDKERRISANVLAKANALYAEAKPLWVKVGVLRNNAFGHRSDSKTIEEIFKEAGITPNQLKKLIELTKRLLNTISRALDGSVHAFNLAGTEATLRVLQDLKERREG
jgi:hypothetical protein